LATARTARSDRFAYQTRVDVTVSRVSPGFLWTLVTPMVMIAIFTIIFAGIFKAKFGVSSSQWDYALYLFCGLLPWNAFHESVQLSTSTIVAHANLVKRVVFPLETLPVSLTRGHC
jgi:lipopolysaccharide transport system permease protein